MNSSQESIPWLVRRFSTPFGRRHVKAVAIARWLVAGWLAILATIFCVIGGSYWWGALLFLPAVLNGVLAFRLPRWKVALDALQNGPRVRELERARARVVDDAATRLRRIEQDLHDGAQAQLVAVVMKLALSKEHLAKITPGPDRAALQRVAALVDAAHRGALEAIRELRDLARGIYPPVLGEGLIPALEVLADRSDTPVDVVVELPERPSPAIETIAYFCVAELLTNITKHSGARQASVEVSSSPGTVMIRVRDDGGGGAHVEAGGGLAGLAQRVAAVDGALQLDSPLGGPTTVSVDLPSQAGPRMQAI